jgi:MFS family permease
VSQPDAPAPDAPRHGPAPHELWAYLGSRLAGSLAIQVQSLGIAWQVYDRTRQPLDLGWVGLAQFVPMALLSLWAGSVADRVDRRRMLLVSRVVFGLASLTMAALTFAPRSWGVGPIYAVLVVLGATRAFAAPASWALLPALVEGPRLARAIGLSSTTFQIATIGGPALGGLLYATVGPLGAYLFSALAELAGIACLASIRRTLPRPELPKERGLALLLSGVRYVWQSRVLLGAISLDLFAVLLGGAVALMPIYARDILDVGETGLGLLRSAPAVGAAIVAAILSAHPIRRRAGHFMFGSVALFGLATIAFGLSTRFELSLLALAVLGGADMVSVVIRQSIVQLSTPDEMRGRVASVNMIFIGASNELGEFESGATAAWLGTVRSVVVGGVGTLLVTGLWAVLFPALRRAETAEEK